MIHFHCSRCFHRITADNSQRGLGVSCPYCHKLGKVPLESEPEREQSPEAKVDDDSLLSMIEIDDEADLEIVEEEPFDPDIRLVPVKCSACKTRFYGSENQIGKYRKCPDCDKLNQIPNLEPEYRVVVELSPNGGYYVHDPEVSGGQMFRINADYCKIPNVQRNEAIPEIYVHNPEPKPRTIVVESPPVLTDEEYYEKEPPTAPGELLRNFFSPFLNPKSRLRLIVLLFLGFLGGLFAIQTVTWIGQGYYDTVPDKPGHVYTGGEMLLFFANYMIGTSVIAIGLIFVLIYAILICMNSYREKDNSTRWGAFDTDYGMNIFTWLILVTMGASIPGVFIGLCLMFLLPESFFRIHLILCQGISIFLFFPPVFLAMLENDFFYDFVKPKRTYRSFGKLWKTWSVFYLVSGAIFGFCLTPMLALSILGTTPEIATALNYTIFFALSCTLAGVFAPLLYFRLIGRMGWIIKETIEKPEIEENDGQIY